MIDPSQEFQTLQQAPLQTTLPQQATPHQVVAPTQAQQGARMQARTSFGSMAQNGAGFLGQRTTQPLPNQNRPMPQQQMNRPQPMQQSGFHTQQAQPQQVNRTMPALNQLHSTVVNRTMQPQVTRPQAPQQGALQQAQFGNQARSPAMGVGQHTAVPTPGASMQGQAELDH